MILAQPLRDRLNLEESPRVAMIVSTYLTLLFMLFFYFTLYSLHSTMTFSFLLLNSGAKGEKKGHIFQTPNFQPTFEIMIQEQNEPSIHLPLAIAVI